MLSLKQYPSAAPEQAMRKGDQPNLLELQEQLLGKRSDRDTSAKLVDKVLAKEFSSLSVQERSRTYEDIHGVIGYVEETPVFIQNSLQQLDDALSRITPKRAYEIAEKQDKDYVMDVKFRLMFLRAESFHPGKAAARLVGYFEGMLRFFGECLLTRRIQYNDLDANDQTCVKAGHMQPLPTRDRSGRVVFTDVDNFKDQSYVNANNRLKACIYMWLMLAEDEESQKRGLVLVVLQMGFLDLAGASLTVTREIPRLLDWLPIRVCALHFCSDDRLTGFLFRAAGVGVPEEGRARLRYHIGTRTEIMYSLLSFGLPVDLIPYSESGTIKKTNLNRWIAKYIARDKEMAKNGGAFSGVDLPSRNDVLHGKGKPFQNHPGNAHLRVLVESNIDEYQAAYESVDKMNVVYKVFAEVKATSGRFLEKDDVGWWRESHDVDAVDKVRMLFQRTHRKEKLQRDHLAQSPPDQVGDYASMFLHQGKRPRFDTGCCGT
jgi:hypothetical protein